MTSNRSDMYSTNSICGSQPTAIAALATTPDVPAAAVAIHTRPTLDGPAGERNSGDGRREPHRDVALEAGRDEPRMTHKRNRGRPPENGWAAQRKLNRNRGVNVGSAE